MPKELNPDAPVPTYKIDRIVEENDELKNIHDGHSHYALSTARRFRHAFNSAMSAAVDIDRLNKEFADRHTETDYLFQELRRLGGLLDKTDVETISAVAVPAEPERPYDATEKDAERVGDAFGDLRAAIASFLNTVELPNYHSAGRNHDHMTHRFIERLAGDWRLQPFTPVTRANWKPFVRLLAAGWEDLSLPRGRGGGNSYHSVYGWLSDRVRKQLGFCSSKKPVQNPKRFPGPQHGRT
jgi:hypothetical protein